MTTKYIGYCFPNIGAKPFCSIYLQGESQNDLIAKIVIKPGLTFSELDPDVGSPLNSSPSYNKDEDRCNKR